MVLGLAYYSFKYFYGSMEFRKNTGTPQAFLNQTVNKKEDYTKDSLAISKDLKAQLLQHEYFFYSKEYFEGTEIIIDTILYSPDFNQLAILFLTKNPTSRQTMLTENEDFYYDATAYLGIREKDSITLSWLGPRFSNSTDRNELSKLVRVVYFSTFVSKDTTKNIQINITSMIFAFGKVMNGRKLRKTKYMKKSYKRKN